MSSPELPRIETQTQFVYVPEGYWSNDPVDAIRVTRASEPVLLDFDDSNLSSISIRQQLLPKLNVNYLDASGGSAEFLIIPPTEDDDTEMHYLKLKHGRAYEYVVDLGLDSANVRTREKASGKQGSVPRGSVIVGVKKYLPTGGMMPGGERNTYSDTLLKVREAAQRYDKQHRRFWGKQAMRG